MAVADAEVSLKQHEANNSMSHLVDDLSSMQQQFSMNGELLLEVISEVETSYAESVNRLSEAMGHIQFQDVMRQRLEHAQEAILEVRDHLLSIARNAGDERWDGAMEQGFVQLLAAHLGRYRMASQTMTHLTVAGGATTADHSRPAIELF